MLGYFLADGVSSNDFDVFLTDAGVYGIAERDVEPISVVGKNGDLLRDNHRYKNKTFSYPSIIRGNFDECFSALINYLNSRDGYMRIEDSFLPDIYLKARYIGETDPKLVTTRGKDGEFDLMFDRKPQKFLKEGERFVEFTTSSSILNRYRMTALPLVRVYGTGTVTINGVAITINSANVYTDLDCETENAYKGSTDCNGNITLNNKKEFFKLDSGANTITLSGVSKIEIKPNWWIL